MGLGPYGLCPIWARAIWAPGPWAPGPSLLGKHLTKKRTLEKRVQIVFFVCFLETKKMRDVRTIILAAVSRRDLCYVSENKGFRFVEKTITKKRKNKGKKTGSDAPAGCLRRTPHKEILLFYQGVMLRQAAFGKHLTENGPFFKTRV